MCVAQRVEFRADLIPLLVDLIVLFLELPVAVLTGHPALTHRRVLILIDLRERLLAFRVLQLEEARREERLVVDGPPAHDVVKQPLRDARFDALFESLHDLLCDHGHRFHRPLELEVLFEQRVLRASLRGCLAQECPVLLGDVLGFERSNFFA